MKKEQHPLTGEVDRRLRIVSELRNLCLSLGRAKRITGFPPAPDLPPRSNSERVPAANTGPQTP